MRSGNVGNIAKQLQQKKRVQMSVLQPSQQPLAHEGQEVIKKSSSAKKLFMEEVIQEFQRQDNGKQVVEKEQEQEEQTPNAMQTADVDDQVLGSSAMHSDACELRTDGHERDGGKKRKRMSRQIGTWIKCYDNDACELRIDKHERVLDEQTVSYFVEFLGTLSRTSIICPSTMDKWIDMNKVYKDAKEKMWDYVKVDCKSLVLHTKQLLLSQVWFMHEKLHHRLPYQLLFNKATVFIIHHLLSMEAC
ncbi:hypothetical protein Dimus_018057 [Dionaea muscipula]